MIQSRSALVVNTVVFCSRFAPVAVVVNGPVQRAEVSVAIWGMRPALRRVIIAKGAEQILKGLAPPATTSAFGDS